MTETPITFLRDAISDRTSLNFSELPYSLRLHEDVSSVLDRVGGPNLRKRLIFALQRLAVNGRTDIVKGCTGENSGWNRTPLGGGSNGMGYYLWWAPGGRAPIAAREKAPGDNTIWVRDLRRHDDHVLLTAGDLDAEYFPLSLDSIDGTDQSIGSPPWTEEQQRFISNRSPVRVLHGHPGSGKTLALLRAIETRGDEKVLYVSWSRDLTRLAEERLAAFAADGTDVVTRDFVSLLGTICHIDVPRPTYAQSRGYFTEARDMTKISPDVLGPWAGHEDALYAEFRAILLGRAIPGAPGCFYMNLEPPNRRMVRLTDASYREVRGGGAGIGSAGADSFLRVVELMQRHAARKLGDAFPEMVAAAEAIKRLRQGDLPDGFAGFKRIVVDEVQDLTLTELAVIVELCLATARRSGGSAPYLLLAGDEGQTVRPAGFEWALLNGLLNDRLQAPEEFFLDTHLRSPQRISQVIENASKLYAGFQRGMRPSGQQHEPGGQAIEGRLFYVEVPDNTAAVALLEQLASVPGLATVTLENEVPDWVPEPLQAMVLTPAIVKGLEYQAVIVLNPGELLKKLRHGISEHTGTPELEEHHRRAAIDRLRVAVSRASETLVFVDVAADDEARELARGMLGDPAVYNADDLVALLSDTDAETPLEDAIKQRVDEVRRLIDEAPGRAWQLAVHCVKELGGWNSPELVSQGVRRDGQMVLLETAARLLVDGLPPRVSRDEVLDQAEAAITGLETPEIGAAFHCLEEWTRNRSMPPCALLNAATTVVQDTGWMRNAIRSVSQTLVDSLEGCAEVPQEAGGFVGDVEGWLRLVGYGGDVAGTAMELRRSAATTLLKAGDLAEAERILPAIQPPSAALTGLHLETQGKWEAAAEAYAQAALDEDALRMELESAKVLEREGRFEEAAHIYERAGLDEDARRISDLAGGLVQVQPPNIHVERRRLRRVIDPYTAAIKKAPDGSISRARACKNRGDAYYELGQNDQAISDYKAALLITPKEPDVYASRGYAYLGQGNLEEAHADFVETIALAQSPGKSAEAIENFAKISELDYVIARARCGLGTIKWSKGDHSSAIPDFDEAIALSPNFAEAYGMRGGTYNSLGEYRRAIEDLDLTIELAPTAFAYTERGVAYNGLGEYHRAIEDLDLAIELGPNLSTYNTRGIAHLSLGKKDLAMEDFQKALMLARDDTTRAMMEYNILGLNG